DIFAKKVVTPAPIKAVEESCVTCGGPHAHYDCDATNSNKPSVYVATGTYNQVAPQNYASNYMAPPGFAPVQNSQNRFNQNQGQGNNFNRGNNFHAVEESCVTCGGPHAHYDCDATNSNKPSVYVATGTYNQVAPQNYASNYMAPPGFAPVQNSQNRFNQNQGQGNNFNRGNNFHGNQPFQVPNQGFQNQPFQIPNNQVQQGFSNEFSSYKKANDQMIRSVKNQISSLKEEFKNEI
nr:hypothetical protein [Tanacetum cinerariifolium]